MDGVDEHAGTGLLDVLQAGIGGFFGLKAAQAQARGTEAAAAAATRLADTQDTRQADLIKFILGAVVLGGLAALLIRAG